MQQNNENTLSIDKVNSLSRKKALEHIPALREKEQKKFAIGHSYVMICDNPETHLLMSPERQRMFLGNKKQMLMEMRAKGFEFITLDYIEQI